MHAQMLWCRGVIFILSSGMEYRTLSTDVKVLELLFANFFVLGWNTELCAKCVADCTFQCFCSG